MFYGAKIDRFYTIPVHELFGYFVDPVLLQHWSYPDGMILKVVHFDGRPRGKYHFELAARDGIYVCNGHIHKYALNQRLRRVDDEILSPAGKILAENIACDIIFTSFGSGSGVEIAQSGFSDGAYALACEAGWVQALDRLQDLVKDSGLRQFNGTDYDHDFVQT